MFSQKQFQDLSGVADLHDKYTVILKTSQLLVDLERYQSRPSSYSAPNSIPRHRFIQIENRIANHCPGSDFRHFQFLVTRRFAHFQQLLRGSFVFLKFCQLPIQNLLQNGKFLLVRLARWRAGMRR